MNAQFEKLQRKIDRQLAALAPHLRAPALSPQRLASINAALADELRRLQRRQRYLVALRPWVAVAAAVLLAVGFNLPRGSRLLAPGLGLNESAELALADWADALGESGERFTRLFDEDWVLDDFGAGADDGGMGGDPLDSLRESLESFEQMIGA